MCAPNFKGQWTYILWNQTFLGTILVITFACTIPDLWPHFLISNCFYQHDFFIARFFRSEKKPGKSSRLNSKIIRFDQKKWKDNLVLHYLISKWIFFLITFRRHQDLQILISPKSLILQTKKFLENDGRIQKWLKRLGFCRKV